MPKTLLLADDSVTIQKVVGISFASEDIKLVTVDNGTAAVAKAKEVRPDIVLADVVMPGLNGYEVCRQIKADPALRRVPVLLLTGTFEAFDEARARDAGSDGHITKPFEAQALVDLVNARLASASGPAPVTAPEKSVTGDAPTFGEDEPFDFMAEEVTEPSGTRASSALASDALSFGEQEGLELGDPSDLDAEPLEVEALTQVALADADSGVAPIEDGDDDENAETLPPVAADPEDPAEASPAATRVVFAQSRGRADVRSGDELAATNVLLGEPEAVGVGTLRPAEAGVDEGDPFAGVGDDRHDVAPTDLGDPFADDEEPLAPAASAPAPTVVIPSGDNPAWPTESDDLFDAPAAAAPPRAGRAVVEAAEGAAAARLPSRDELRNLLEKMAWEAFGDVTDRIVRETVERVEQIAWEVIPKLAETLIREEIRKLKEEDAQ